MAIEGELTGLAETVMCDCGEEMPLKVLHSPAGWYIGRWCQGPYSRETDYFKSPEEAQFCLAAINSGLIPPQVRTTEYRG